MRASDNDAIASVAIVIPCWNAENWIERAVESALAQDWSQLQVVVVDDGSTDNSLTKLNALGDRIEVLTGPNQGAQVARNRGLRAATSKYVLFLDADDYLEKGAIEAWVKEINDADLLFGPFVRERDGERFEPLRPSKPVTRASLLSDWSEGRFTPPCAVLWRRSFLNSIGGWNEKVKRKQDSELVFRAVLAGAKCVLAEGGLGIYVQHDGPDRISSRTGRAILEGEYELFERLLGMANTKNEPALAPIFARAFYRIAYEGYVIACDDVANRALKKSRELGLAGHVGPLQHRVFASFFGLRRKQKLAGIVRKHLAPQ